MSSPGPNERVPNASGLGQPYASAPPFARFVGRESERVVLLAALDAAVAGLGNLVLLSGEPGIGKTRTCEELDNVARLRGIPVAWGRCWEGGGASPYWPWIQILRFCARYKGSEELVATAGEAASLLASLVPEVFGGEDRSYRRQLSVLDRRDNVSERFALFVGIADLLRNFASKSPLVIVIDDLHAADTDSVLLTQFIARELRQMSILLLVTYRDAQVPAHS